MFPRTTGVVHVKDYTLRVTFADGLVAELDFRSRIVGRGGVFVPLESIELFKQVRVDKEIGALVWPNDVDFDPDVLYSEASGKPIPIPQAQ